MILFNYSLKKSLDIITTMYNDESFFQCYIVLQNGWE